MSKKTESNSYTLLFAFGMVVIVGALLAFVASSLKPTIDKNKRLEKKQNILYAMGVNENQDEGDVTFVTADNVANKFSKYIKKQLVIEGTKVTEDDNAFLIDIKKQQTNAKAGKVRKLPLFVGEKEGKTFYVAPIRGKGLWDAIWAYVALDKNMVIQGIFLDHAGETPGLGANIKQRYFMDDFSGEQTITNNSFKGVVVAKGNNDPLNKDKTDNEIDAIAGATITGDGVSAMIKSELKLYVPYFKTLQ